MSKREGERGIIGLLVILLLALILAKYIFNWSIIDAAATPQGQSTVDYLKQIFMTIWNYLAQPVTFFWQKIVWPIIMVAWTGLEGLLHFGQH
jgi:hypothetical protein